MNPNERYKQKSNKTYSVILLCLMNKAYNISSNKSQIFGVKQKAMKICIRHIYKSKENVYSAHTCNQKKKKKKKHPFSKAPSQTELCDTLLSYIKGCHKLTTHMLSTC